MLLSNRIYRLACRMWRIIIVYLYSYTVLHTNFNYICACTDNCNIMIYPYSWRSRFLRYFLFIIHLTEFHTTPRVFRLMPTKWRSVPWMHQSVEVNTFVERNKRQNHVHAVLRFNAHADNPRLRVDSARLSTQRRSPTMRQMLDGAHCQSYGPL